MGSGSGVGALLVEKFRAAGCYVTEESGLVWSSRWDDETTHQAHCGWQIKEVADD